MKIINVKLTDITPYEKNAKKHPEEQIEQIANSIKEFGWQQPIVLDDNNVIIIGHGRFLAAQKLGYETAPCVYTENLTKQQIKALRLADNKTNESAWDFGLLNIELEELPDIDMSQFGFDISSDFDASALDELFADAPEKEKTPVMITCPHCGEKFEL